MRASWTREVTPSFQKTCRRWKATVWVLRKTRLATWRLLRPWATRSVMVRSVSVRLSQPKGLPVLMGPVAQPGAHGAQPGSHPGRALGRAELLI